MGQTQGKVDGDAQAQLMEVQRNYVNVRMEDVDFSNPTAVDDDDDDDEEEAGGQGDEAQTVEEDVRYEAYTPRVVKIKGMKRHPSDAVENGTLATVAPPAVTYALKLAEERPKVVKEGRLSDLQLEFVTYACQRHDEDLASGARAGFFLGDGAGMGKGRQLAGLILENVLQGRKKHIWVSTGVPWIERFGASREIRGGATTNDSRTLGRSRRTSTSTRTPRATSATSASTRSPSSSCPRSRKRSSSRTRACSSAPTAA